MKSFNERELVRKLDKILMKEFGTNLSFHEFSAGYGIADLVLAPNFSFKKNNIGRTPLTSFNGLNLFLMLENKKEYDIFNIQKIFNHLTTCEVKREIKALLDCQYIKKVGTNRYIKITQKNGINPIKRIVAVEVKLNDHKAGLTQARRYQYFADDSYLAILKDAEKNIDFDEFNKHNIGLILFDRNTNSIEIKSPIRANYNCDNSVNLFAKEMMFNRFINLSF